MNAADFIFVFLTATVGAMSISCLYDTIAG